MYGSSDMQKLWMAQYTHLFQTRSPRETEILSKVSFDRDLYDLVSLREPSKVNIEEAQPGDVELVAVSMTLKNVENAEEKFDRWYEDEHIDLLSKIHGWLRTPRFKPSSIAQEKEVTYLA
jgi:hypothetical protein